MEVAGGRGGAAASAGCGDSSLRVSVTPRPREGWSREGLRAPSDTGWRGVSSSTLNCFKGFHTLWGESGIMQNGTCSGGWNRGWGVWPDGVTQRPEPEPKFGKAFLSHQWQCCISVPFCFSVHFRPVSNLIN